MLREQLLEKKSVLVVEDNDTMSGVLVMMVRSLGARVVDVATTFDHAFSICELNRYDVILMDVHLDHGKDGIALVKAVKARGWDHDALLIFVTGSISRSVVDSALQVGPDGYVAKPLSCASLANSIWKATLQRKRNKLAEAGVVTATSAESSVPD